jgi:hypothetical protein
MEIRSAMRLLVDTDIFCKLGVAGLLHEAVKVLGVPISECGRLAALPHMLKRGRLAKLYGPDRCGALLPLVEAMPVADAPGTDWIEPFRNVPAIDAGEAQLLALVAQHGLILLSGDKRALRALASVHAVLPSLGGRIVTLEAILIALCWRIGVDAVRQALQALQEDLTVKVCFSPGNPDPVDALASYFGAIQREAAPLVLWKPTKEAS